MSDADCADFLRQALASIAINTGVPDWIRLYAKAILAQELELYGDQAKTPTEPAGAPK